MRWLTLVLMIAIAGCGGDDDSTPDATGPSDDATLASLVVVELPGALFPAFDPLLTAYTAPAGLSVANVTLTATANDPGATVRIGTEVLGPGEPSIPFVLALGDTWIDVEVTAANGDIRNYCVTITRAGDLASTYVKAPLARLGDNFGYAIDVAGDTLVVTASGEDSGATGVDGDPSSQTAPQSGAAYVYVRAGGGWALDAYLKASNPELYDYFGWSVAIDGDTIVVGAPAEDSDGSSDANNSLVEAGAAFVFVRTGDTWAPQAYLKAPMPETNGFFGGAVDISGDTIAIGSYNDGSPAASAGVVDVYTRTGTTWSHQQTLTAETPAVEQAFGFRVALDGDTLVAGAIGEDVGAGAAYVFTRTGTTWSQQARLEADAPAEGDSFGSAVALDGDTIAIGASREQARTGAAYVFTRTGTTWSAAQRLTASNPAEGDELGSSLALAGDHLVIGAIAEDSGTPGVNAPPDEAAEDAGAGYLFSRAGGVWSVTGYLKASNPGEGDVLGYAVAASEDALIFGAISEDSAGVPPDEAALNAGAIYVFEGGASGGAGSATGSRSASRHQPTSIHRPSL